MPRSLVLLGAVTSAVFGFHLPAQDPPPAAAPVAAPAAAVGFPSKPEEVDHFVTMLRAAKANLTDPDIEFLKKSLDGIREQDEAKKKAGN